MSVSSDARTNLISQLRAKVSSYLELQQYATACYWADKLVCFGKSDPKDVVLYAQALYQNKQFHRTISLLTRHGDLMKFLLCRYIVAQCHYACGECDSALAFLENSPSTTLTGTGAKSQTPILAKMESISSKVSCDGCPTENELLLGFTLKSLQSSVALLRGKIHETLENRVTAMQCYREALSLDVTCYEAFEKLVHFQSLTALEEVTLLINLDFHNQLDPNMAKLVEFLYEDKTNKRASSTTKIPDGLDLMAENVDVLVNLAERMLNVCKFQQCCDITSRILRVDPYNFACLPVHISALKELNRPNDLFMVAHKLLSAYPSNSISWFAIGCYYLCTQKNELARRHLFKASQLDKRFGPTWLALGHAFAADGEHDQAIASYCTAAQVIRGSHVPITYIGIEYSASNNRSFAERFLLQAFQLNANDPFTLHELGTLAFQTQKYSDAMQYLTQAYDKVCDLGDQVISAFWEPLVNNMAHTCRKLRMFDRAIELHQTALRLLPDSQTTLAGLALVYAMMGQTSESVDYLHRALRVHPINSGASAFAASMLSICTDLLTTKSSDPSSQIPGRDLPDSFLQKPLPPATRGSMLGVEKIRIKKRSPDISATSKSSANALHLDVMFHTVPTETPSRSLDSSDEDVTMELG